MMPSSHHASQETCDPDCHAIGEMLVDFSVVTPGGAMEAPEHILQCARAHLLPELGDLLDGPEADGIVAVADTIEVDLGTWPADPDWDSVRRDFREKLWSALAPYIRQISEADHGLSPAVIGAPSTSREADPSAKSVEPGKRAGDRVERSPAVEPGHGGSERRKIIPQIRTAASSDSTEAPRQMAAEGSLGGSALTDVRSGAKPAAAGASNAESDKPSDSDKSAAEPPSSDSVTPDARFAPSKRPSEGATSERTASRSDAELRHGPTVPDIFRFDEELLSMIVRAVIGQVSQQLEQRIRQSLSAAEFRNISQALNVLGIRFAPPLLDILRARVGLTKTGPSQPPDFNGLLAEEARSVLDLLLLNGTYDAARDADRLTEHLWKIARDAADRMIDLLPVYAEAAPDRGGEIVPAASIVATRRALMENFGLKASNPAARAPLRSARRSEPRQTFAPTQATESHSGPQADISRTFSTVRPILEAAGHNDDDIRALAEVLETVDRILRADAYTTLSSRDGGPGSTVHSETDMPQRALPVRERSGLSRTPSSLASTEEKPQTETAEQSNTTAEASARHTGSTELETHGSRGPKGEDAAAGPDRRSPNAIVENRREPPNENASLATKNPRVGSDTPESSKGTSAPKDRTPTSQQTPRRNDAVPGATRREQSRAKRSDHSQDAREEADLVKGNLHARADRQVSDQEGDIANDKPSGVLRSGMKSDAEDRRSSLVRAPLTTGDEKAPAADDRGDKQDLRDDATEYEDKLSQNNRNQAGREVNDPRSVHPVRPAGKDGLPADKARNSGALSDPASDKEETGEGTQADWEKGRLRPRGDDTSAPATFQDSVESDPRRSGIDHRQSPEEKKRADVAATDITEARSEAVEQTFLDVVKTFPDETRQDWRMLFDVLWSAVPQGQLDAFETLWRSDNPPTAGALMRKGTDHDTDMQTSSDLSGQRAPSRESDADKLGLTEEEAVRKHTGVGDTRNGEASRSHREEQRQDQTARALTGPSETSSLQDPFYLYALARLLIEKPGPDERLEERLAKLFSDLIPDPTSRAALFRQLDTRLSYADGRAAPALRRRARAVLRDLAANVETGLSADRPSGSRATDPRGERAYLTGLSGLVIFAPYFGVLFDRLGARGPERTLKPESLAQARRALQLMGDSTSEEVAPTDPLIKLLLGQEQHWRFDGIPADPQPDAALIESLLKSVIAQWSALGGTSPEGLREAFIRRGGSLRMSRETWVLTVDTGPFDMLLDKLPWPVSPIALAWMPLPLQVVWRLQNE